MPLDACGRWTGVYQSVITFRLSRVRTERTVFFPLVLLQSEFPVEMKMPRDINDVVY